MTKETDELTELKESYREHPENTVTALNLAQQYCNRGWFNEAFDIYRSTLELDPEDVTVLLEYGNAVYKKGDIKTAIGLFRRLTDLRTERIEGWNNLGIACTQCEEHEHAREAFTRVLELEPENSGALLNMGNYHSGRGEFERAKECFKRATAVRADFPDGWYNLGNTCIQLGQYQEARLAFEKALRYYREFPSALKNLGWVYEHEGRLDDALQCYHDALLINKADARLYVNIGNVFIRQKKYDEAKKNFLKAVRLSPNDLHGWMGLRGYALAKGDVGTFVRATMTVLGKLSDETLAQSIDILYELNQIDKADELLSQADRLGRRSDLIDLQRLLLYQRQEREPQKAAEILERLSGLEKMTDMMHRGLARYYLNSGDYVSAISSIKFIEQPDAAASGILWRAMLAQGKTKEVRRALRDDIAANPENYDTYFLLASIEAQHGNQKRAETLLVHALDHGFNNMEEIHGHPQLNEIFESMTSRRLLEEAYE